MPAMSVALAEVRSAARAPSARRPRAVPVLGVPAGSTSSMWHSSVARGQCSTPRGTTYSSPGPRVTGGVPRPDVERAVEDQGQLTRLGVRLPDELAPDPDDGGSVVVQLGRDPRGWSGPGRAWLTLPLGKGRPRMQIRRDPDGIHPPAGGYSHQIEVRGPERLLVMAGQIGVSPDGTLPADGLEQLGIALDNVRRNLEAAGMGIGDLVKLTLYVVGTMDTEARRKLVARKMGGQRPCMTYIQVAGLASPDLKVEVDAWASAGAD